MIKVKLEAYEYAKKPSHEKAAKVASLAVATQVSHYRVSFVLTDYA